MNRVNLNVLVTVNLMLVGLLRATKEILGLVEEIINLI